MKKIATLNSLSLPLLLFFFLISFGSHASEWVPITSNVPKNAEVNLVSSDIRNTVMNFKVSGFYKSEVVTPRGTELVISCGNTSPVLSTGTPDLPKIASSVIIPDLSKMKVIVTQSAFVDIQNVAVAPSKGNLYRNVNPSDVPYVYGNVYNKNTFAPQELAELQQPYILRDFRGQTVWVYPFSYNAITQTLRVYTDITITITEESSADNRNPLLRSSGVSSIDRDFQQIYSNTFPNFNSSMYTGINEEGTMLIISHGAYMPALQDFINWKTKKGISIELVDVSTIGVNATQIQNYIDAYYNANNLKYVLLVGDAQQVPTLTASGGASDPSYSYILGNDSYSEIFVGRFSAESISDVATQVQRVLEYEMNPQQLNGWQGRGICIASDQGPGDDNELDYEHQRVIRTKELAFSFNAIAELYDGSQGMMDAPGDPVPNDLSVEINNGASIITYTGHGSQFSFGTTSFSNSQIPSLTNVGMLPFIWSVACVNGEFAQGTCFAEFFMRAKNTNGDPIGAVATFMSSINQSWNPPMDGQDEMVDLLVGTYGSDVRRTFGGLSVNGCMHMNDQYGAAGAEMTDTWHCFGDPSLNVRTANAQTITATHVPVVLLGTNQLNIGCITDSAYAVITLNGVIIGSGLVINGNVIVNFPALTVLDTLYVTITAFNHIPYSGQVLVLPASGPYVINVSTQVNDPSGNNNNLPDYGETIVIDATFENVGQADASNVTASLSTLNPNVNITGATQPCGTIATGNTVSFTGAFTYQVNNNVTDQEPVLFELQISDNQGNTWSSSFTHIMNAPSLNATTLVINDVTGNNNGVLDPGETADIVITTLNAGGSNTIPSIATLLCADPNITLNSTQHATGIIGLATSAQSTFNVTMNSNMQIGTVFSFDFEIVAGAYSASYNFVLTAGEILEDFETGDFTKYPWTLAGASPWIIDPVTPFQGSYSASSGIIADGETSVLNINLDVASNDAVSFYVKTSTETDWDFLKFYIDGVEQGTWDGEVPWTYVTIPVNQGVHLLTWSYEKDSYCCIGGSDAVWLDNILLPPSSFVTSVNSPIAGQFNCNIWPNPSSDNAFLQLELNEKTYVSVSIFNSIGEIVSMPLTGSAMPAGKNVISLESGNLSAGIYFCNVQAGDSNRVIKLVITD